MKTPLGYAPHLYGAVFGGACDEVVVVRTPLDVQNCRLVTTHQRRVSVHPAYLWVGGLGGLLKIDLQWCLGMKKKVVRQGVV